MKNTLLCVVGFLGAILNHFSESKSLGAKQGTITAPTGSDLNMRALGDSSPVRDTLAGIVRTALGLASALKKSVIGFYDRKAIVVAEGIDAAALLEVTGVEELGFFEKDDASKASAPWTFNTTNMDTALNAALVGLTAAAKPSLSVESLVNKIDEMNDEILGGDLIATDASLGGLIVVWDQAGQVVRVSRADTTAHASAAIAAIVSADEDAQFVQTPSSAASAQFGE